MKILPRLSVIFAVALQITTSAAAPLPPAINSPEGIVFKVYHDYAWEAVMAGGYDGLLEQPRKVLQLYFDDNLTNLILRDRACAEREGMCRLDFDPIWASQDPSAEDLRVKKTDKTNIISVKFRHPSTDEKIDLKYRVTKTAKGWRISDISAKDWSLLAILSSSE